MPRVPRLQMARVRVTLESLGSGELPRYLGSTIRGAFGHVFKRIGCARPPNCNCTAACQLPGRCAYSYVFETPVPKPLHGRLGGPFAPHPFVICPLDDGGATIRPGCRISFSVTLLGRGITFFPFILATVEELGRQGLGAARIPHRLAAVTDNLAVWRNEEAPLAASRPLPEPALFEPRSHQVLGTPTLLDLRETTERAAVRFQEQSPEGMRIRLVTPTRMVRDGTTMRLVDLDLLLAAMHRRLEALTLFHGEGPRAWDSEDTATPRTDTPLAFTQDVYEQLSPRLGNSLALRAASRIVTVDPETTFSNAEWERFSNRQNRKLEVDGVLGELVLRDVPPELTPWLMAGQWVHVGKATSFGMGRYAVDPLWGDPAEATACSGTSPRAATTTAAGPVPSQLS